MNKDDNNRHFVLSIIDKSKHGAKEMGHVGILRKAIGGLRSYPWEIVKYEESNGERSTTLLPIQ